MSAADSENLRSMAQMRDLPPVEYAFRALACLSLRDRLALEARFNEVFGPPRRNWTTVKFADGKAK